MPGIGEQRQRPGHDPDDDLHQRERNDQPERDRQWPQVSGARTQRCDTAVVVTVVVTVSVLVAVVLRSHRPAPTRPHHS